MKCAVRVGVALMVVGVAGCASETAGTAVRESVSPDSPTTSAAAVSDEQQIHDLIEKEKAALVGFQFDQMAALTCPQYRADILNQPNTMFPPLSEVGTREALATNSPDVLVPAFKRQHPDASDATIRELVDALIRYDEPAYQAANLKLLRETASFTIDKVDNLKVTGDTATADITSSWTTDGVKQPGETRPNTFLKVDGVWLDCEPPAEQ